MKLITDRQKIGNAILAARERKGLTQIDTAVAADISDRCYCSIERGETGMRVETLLKICEVLSITPDDVLTEKNRNAEITKESVKQLLENCSEQEMETSLKILKAYLESVH